MALNEQIQIYLENLYGCERIFKKKTPGNEKFRQRLREDWKAYMYDLEHFCEKNNLDINDYYKPIDESELQKQGSFILLFNSMSKTLKT